MYRETVPLGSGWEVRELGKNINTFSQSPLLEFYDSVPITPVADTCYARYLGCAPDDFSNVVLGHINGAVAAAAIVYAEVGIGSGDFPVNDSTLSIDPTITPIGYANVSAVVNGDNQQKVVNVPLTYKLKAGQGVWALFSVNATTMPGMRAVLNANHFGRACTRANTRISTNLNTALIFTGAAAGAAISTFHFHAQYRR